MIILITGTSHVGKTALAQKLLEKYKYDGNYIVSFSFGVESTGKTKTITKNGIVLKSGNDVILPLTEDNKIFIELYDIVTDNLTTRKGDIQRAQMYLNRAKLLSQDEQNYEAINLLGVLKF